MNSRIEERYYNDKLFHDLVVSFHDNEVYSLQDIQDALEMAKFILFEEFKSVTDKYCFYGKSQ